MKPARRKESLFDLSTFLSRVRIESIENDQGEELVVEQIEEESKIEVRSTVPSCNTCSATFENHIEQRAHFQSKYHLFNLKLKLSGAPSLSLDQFENLGKVEDSDSDDSSDDEQCDVDTSQQDFHSKSSKLGFVSDQGERFFIWRCVVNDKLKRVDETLPDFMQRSLARLSIPRNGQWTILLCSGGRFAGAVYQSQTCIVHKTFHRYTTRKKQGGSQAAADSRGTVAKSAGSTLRRYNEVRLREQIHQVLIEWKKLIIDSSTIFLSAAKGHSRDLFLFEGSPIDLKDPRLQSVPFPIIRPTFSEVGRVHSILSTVDFIEKGDTASSSASIPVKQRLNKDDKLYVAIRLGDVDHVKRLIEEDHTYEFVRSADLAPPVFVACEEGNVDIVAYLCTVFPADVNVSMPSKGTPLHVASSMDRQDIAEVLLRNGADPTIKASKGETPFDVARSAEMKEFFQFYAGAHPDDWNWAFARINPLTQEIKDEQQRRRIEQQQQQLIKKKKAKKIEKEKAIAASTKQVTKVHAPSVGVDEEKRFVDALVAARSLKERSLSDRERRAMAAESRFKPTLCDQCQAAIAGLPFVCFERRFCSTRCAVTHRNKSTV